MPLSNAEKQAAFRKRRVTARSNAVDQIKTVLADLETKFPDANMHAELIRKYLEDLK